MNAPVRNLSTPKLMLKKAENANITTPQTARPASIETTSETYTNPGLRGSSFVRRPANTPYAASSNAIAAAVGNSGGMPRISERSSGETAPTTSPYTGPHTKPVRNAGMCIGESIAPTAGICPVRNGRYMASASIMPANTRRTSAPL